MTTHACEQCGHKVKYNGELESPVEPDGRHRYVVVISTGAARKGFS